MVLTHPETISFSDLMSHIVTKPVNPYSVVHTLCVLTMTTDAILERLRTALPEHTSIVYSPIPTMTFPPKQLGGSDEVPHDETEQEIDPESWIIFYVGGESLTLTNLLMTHASYQVSCDLHADLISLPYHGLYRCIRTTPKQRHHDWSRHEQTSSSCAGMLSFKRRVTQTFSAF